MASAGNRRQEVCCAPTSIGLARRAISVNALDRLDLDQVGFASAKPKAPTPALRASQGHASRLPALRVEEAADKKQGMRRYSPSCLPAQLGWPKGSACSADPGQLPHTSINVLCRSALQALPDRTHLESLSQNPLGQPVQR